MIDVKKDSYYKKHYGISHQRAENMRDSVGNKCECCERTMSTSLNVDHFHFKVYAERTNDMFRPKWRAEVKPRFKGTTVWYADTRKKAIALAKKEALPLSIRGILCFWCNKGLEYFVSNPFFKISTLDKLKSYLERFEQKIKLDN